MNELHKTLQLPDAIHLSRECEVLVVKLNKPNKRNALNLEIILGLEKLFTTMPDWVKCVVLCGEGKHFSAGLDLSDLNETTLIEGIWHSRTWHTALNSIQFGKVPVISVLHGGVLGGGLELASATHIRVADHTAFYALPEAQHGIYVGGGASVRVPKLIGVSLMQDMMLTGRVYNAHEGHNIGITQYLVDQEPLKMAMTLALKVSSNEYMTNYGVMHVLPRIQEASPDTGFLMESMYAAISQNSPEAKERMRAFFDRKKVRQE